jgi:superfamily II helicase
MAEWRAANKVKKAAHNAVQQAVKSGVLVKPDDCQQCGTNGPLDAHHDDYNHPLKVEWLCRSCHHSRHSEPLQSGERTYYKGQEVVTSKLTEEEVKEIIAFLHPRTVGVRELAQRYKVGQSTIRLILKGVTWKHIPRPTTN